MIYKKVNTICEMSRSVDGESDCISDSFVEAWIGTVSEYDGLSGIVLVILNMTHFVVDRNEVRVSLDGALLDSVVTLGLNCANRITDEKVPC